MNSFLNSSWEYEFSVELGARHRRHAIAMACISPTAIVELWQNENLQNLYKSQTNCHMSISTTARYTRRQKTKRIPSLEGCNLWLHAWKSHLQEISIFSHHYEEIIFEASPQRKVRFIKICYNHFWPPYSLPNGNEWVDNRSSFCFPNSGPNVSKTAACRGHPKQRNIRADVGTVSTCFYHRPEKSYHKKSVQNITLPTLGVATCKLHWSAGYSRCSRSHNNATWDVPYKLLAW